MKNCFRDDKNVPLTLNQTRRSAKKTVAAPRAFLNRICARAESDSRRARPNRPPRRMPGALRKAPIVIVTRRLNHHAAQEPSRKFFAPARKACYSKADGRHKTHFPQSVALDSDSLRRAGTALRAGDVGLGCALQKSWQFKCGHHVLDELARIAVDH